MELWWFIRRWWKQLSVLLLFLILLYAFWPRPEPPPPLTEEQEAEKRELEWEERVAQQPKLAKEVWEEGRLAHITIDRKYINCVRWYGDHPEWCVIHTNDGRVYTLDHPGQKVWDWWLKTEEPGTFKIRGDNIDPISPKARVR
jgi:hypothetical protein